METKNYQGLGDGADCAFSVAYYKGDETFRFSALPEEWSLKDELASFEMRSLVFTDEPDYLAFDRALRTPARCFSIEVYAEDGILRPAFLAFSLAEKVIVAVGVAYKAWTGFVFKDASRLWCRGCRYEVPWLTPLYAPVDYIARDVNGTWSRLRQAQARRDLAAATDGRSQGEPNGEGRAV